MTMTDSVFNCRFVTVVDHKTQIRFDKNKLYQILNSLTNNPRVINRAGVLILVQLASYRLIKLRELKWIIYQTLRQLSYRQLADLYYQRQLV